MNVKRYLKKPFKGLILALTLFMTVSLMHVVSYAVDVTKKGSVTVQVQNISTNFKDLEDYLNQEGKTDALQVDLYKVADLKADSVYDIFTYELNTPFAAEGYDLTQFNPAPKTTAEPSAEPTESPAAGGTTYLDDLNTDDWRDLAQIFAGQVRSGSMTPAMTLNIGQNPSEVETGLYLVIPHGKDMAKTEYFVDETGEDGTSVASIMNTEDYKYTFAPALFVLPSTNADTSTEEMKTSDGEWIYDLTVYLKPTQEPRLSDLIIKKEIETYNSKTPVTAVFNIVSEEKDSNGKPLYTNVASVTLSAAGVESTTIHGIPVGLHLTITEVYSGAGYRAVTATTKTVEILMPAKKETDPVANVTFINTYDNKNTSGYGVNNTFVKETEWYCDNDLPGNTEGCNGAPAPSAAPAGGNVQ